MIKVKVNGPKRQKIIEYLRTKSKADQNSLQMIRISADKLENLQVKKSIKINFPSVTKQMRKNDYPRPLSLSLANQIVQKSYLPEIPSNNLSRVDVEIVHDKFIDKKMPQRKVKSHLQIMRPLHRSQELIKNISNSKKSPNFKVVTVLTNNRKCHLSIDPNKKSKSVQKTSKPLLFQITSHQDKTQSFKAPKNLEISKQKIKCETIVDKSFGKNKQNCDQNYLNNRLSENLSQVLKMRNQGSQKLKNHILRRIRSKQSKYKLDRYDDSKLRLNDSIVSKEGLIDQQSDKYQFQKSLGPWRARGFSFDKQQ